jgi:UDP-N-acetylglucosamine 4,6-dehydratase (inverting)
MFCLKDQTVLITGGTGSFGRQLADYLLRLTPISRLVLFSRDEQKHVELRRNLFPPKQFPQIRYFVGDVRNRDRLKLALRGVDYVVHAAAMKHVDVAEYNPQECIHTNIGGAENLISACLESDVKRVIALSTDKAACPINLYGATKLCSDKLFVAANSLSGELGPRFSVVRYGNVLGSRGSVIPFFQERRSSGRLPVTDPAMTRFIITLEEGIRCVMNAFQIMEGGEIFVPKIPSANIMDIARAVAPECEIDVVGIRPGEKLHECMIPTDESRQTLEFDDHFIIQTVQRSWSSRLPAYVQRGQTVPTDFCFCSDNNRHWLSVELLRELIELHGNENFLYSNRQAA